jgi:hypothetical protein
MRKQNYLRFISEAHDYTKPWGGWQLYSPFLGENTIGQVKPTRRRLYGGFQPDSGLLAQCMHIRMQVQQRGEGVFQR